MMMITDQLQLVLIDRFRNFFTQRIPIAGTFN